MRTKRTYENFKKAVANESKRYPLLKKLNRNGEFREDYLKMAFDLKWSAIQFCNSMTEVT